MTIIVTGHLRRPWLGCTGIPLRVVAVNRPFIAVSDGASTGCLDTRDVVLVRANPRYVRAFNAAVAADRPPPEAFRDDPYRRCPRCGCPDVVQSLRAFGWVYVCRECGYEEAVQ